MKGKVMSNLLERVVSIATNLNDGMTHDYCPECGNDLDYETFDEVSDPCCMCEEYYSQMMSGLDYLTDVFDIQYIVNGKAEYLGARVLVAFGGPNIWVDTRRQTVEGAWWGDHHTESYHTDAMDIDNACREVFSCTINI